MTRKTMTAEEARTYARGQFDEGLQKLQIAEAVYGQIIEQLPFSISLRIDRWNLQRHLQPDWGYASQVGQDKFVHEHFFQETGDGFFVDVGAHDGVTGSNTLFFERVLGWKGLCIEASPTQFPVLRKNRRCSSLNLAVGDRQGTEKFLDVVSGYTQMSGLVDNFLDISLVRNNQDHREREISVPMRRLGEILDEQNVEAVDYCSIDVEGAELRVLRGLDFQRHRISVLSVENAKRHDPIPNTDVKDFLESRGYQFVNAVGFDEIFKLR